MLERAVYLQKPIEHYLNEETLPDLIPTKKEWDQAKLLLMILLPFKKTSDRLQQTSRPSIDSVFWAYETLFNEIDEVQTVFALPKHKERPWIKELATGVAKMRNKLMKYYGKTEKPYVYSDSVILEPWGKGSLFSQESWETDHINRYINRCRDRYIRDYQPVDSTVSKSISKSTSHSLKRKISELADDDDDDDDDDDYRGMTKPIVPVGGDTEFDQYLNAPITSFAKEKTLDWWRRHRNIYPNLSRMSRDTYAVPATGAGVEREFSKSGKVATYSRSRLNHSTVTEIMMFKNFLSRQGQELND